jgi:prepilin-type N-terminal cleavage/methylation domain-containing protein
MRNLALAAKRRSAGVAFTMIELMIVIGIMGLVAAIGVPIVYKVTHKDPFYAAIADIVEVCSNARAQAILKNKMTEVVFHPGTGLVQLQGASGSSGFPKRASAAGLPVSGTSAQISLHHVQIEMLDINLTEYRDQEIARVRFYPNSTSDEMTLILRSAKGEQRGITLEVTTGLASVLSRADLLKLRDGTL